MGSKHKHRTKEKEHKYKHKRRSRSHSRDRYHKKNYDSSSEEEYSSRRKHSPSRDSRRSRSHSIERNKKRKYASESDGESKKRKSPEIEIKNIHTINDNAGSKSESLSIEETNKLREKLGLKPLDTGDTNDDDSSVVKKKEDVHVPAVNWAAEKRTKELVDKLAHNKERRKINKMLGKVKTLGESDEDGDDILSWVKKTSEKEASKLLVAKKEKEMDDLDEAFGLGELIDEEFKKDNRRKMKDNIRRAVYTSKDLSGIKVLHDQTRFSEGTTTILTLKDSKILDENTDDVLINVNIMDNEHDDRNVKNKSKKPQYNAYDDGQEFDEDGVYIGKEVLNKYKDEIEGETMKSFKLDSRGSYNTQYEKQVKQMKADKLKQGHTLAIAMPILAQEYYTQTEMETFKKPTKKRRKIRRKPRPLTADDLLQDGAGGSTNQNGEMGNRAGTTNIDEDMEIDDTKIPGLDMIDSDKINRENYSLGPSYDLSGQSLITDASESMIGGQSFSDVLVKRTRSRDNKLSANQFVGKYVEKTGVVKDEGEDDLLSMDVTSEFCRSLAEISSYKFEKDPDKMKTENEDNEEEEDPGWKSVGDGSSKRKRGEKNVKGAADFEESIQAVLHEEPKLKDGLVGALQLAKQKGFLDENVEKKIGASQIYNLQAKNYSIEDKRHEDLDEKMRKRERGMGMMSDFKEKDNYRPNIKVEYIDDNGKPMDPKEAFRYLSHRFHGKGSGKRKTEKRSLREKREQEMSMLEMPVGTAHILSEKQKHDKQAYVILSGAKSNNNANQPQKISK